MTIHIHDLEGCAPTPLAAYLKALAVIRLVGSQADPELRAWWRGDRSDAFSIATRLDRDALLGFFSSEYRPTPLVTPWNGGSGFYPKDKKDGIDAIAGSAASRFAPYRETIAFARELTEGRDAAPKDVDKARMIAACRNHWRGASAEWLGAALVLTSAGEVAYPALLGTGGNDGRLDFANNQMQRLIELFSPDSGEPRPGASALLEAALFGSPVSGLLGDKAIGQFLPGAAGGINATSGFKGTSLINPWDFALMLEGALLLQVACVRRLDSDQLPQASAPFAVRSQAGGYASACAADESARGEQWMPLWERPATLVELQNLFIEGRLQVGKRRARRALEAARAVARLGAARGITEMVRFGFIERNGQSNLAVPLGRWRVQLQEHAHLLDEVDGWVDRLRRQAGSKTAPASMGRDVRLIERAMLAICREGDRAERWQALLCALGHAEDHLVRRPKATAGLRLQPLPRLSPEWVAAADDGSAEIGLAAAMASQYAAGKHSRSLGTIRAHCLPLDPRRDPRRDARFAVTGEALVQDRQVVWTGGDPVADLGAVAWRRLVECRRHGTGGFELRGRVFARLDHVADFLAGRLDDARMAVMARALMAVDWRDDSAGLLRRETPAACTPPPLYALFRLLYVPGRSSDDVGVLDPTPLRLLLSGRLDAAARHALTRAAATLGRPRLYRAVGSAELARRLAASLCFPISYRDLDRLRHILLKPDDDDRVPDHGTDGVRSRT